jgi:hypothetical protein
MAAKRATKVQIEKYIHQITELLIKGYDTTGDILRYVAEMDRKTPKQKIKAGWTSILNHETGKKRQTWEPVEKSKRTLEGYIAEARKKLKEHYEETRKELIGTVSARYSHIYREAMAKKDLRAAIQAQNGLAKICGLEQTKVTGGLLIQNADYPLPPEEQKEFDEKIKRIMGEEL